MICAFPFVRENPLTHKLQLTPCGHCIQCRINRRLVWTYRLTNEYRKWHYVGSFVTATYSDDKYDCLLGLNYSHIQKYFKRLRKAGYKFKYFVTGEYGSDTARCHWHILFFGIPSSERKRLFEFWNYCYYPRFTCEPITSSRIRYCLKYLDKENFSRGSWYDIVDEDPLFFAFDLSSGKLLFSKHGVQAPRSWCSHGLGQDNFIKRFPELFYSGTFNEGCKVYKPSKYQIELLSRNSLKFAIARSKWFDNNYSIQQEISKVGLKQFQYNNQIQSLNNEFSAIRDAHINGQSVSQENYFKLKAKSVSALDLLEEKQTEYNNKKYYIRALKMLSDASEGSRIDFIHKFDDLCQIYQGFDSYVRSLLSEEEFKAFFY